MDEVKLRDQQYFPTYHLSPEAVEVSLREYELAGSTLAAEEKVLNLSTSLLVGIIGVAFAFYKDNSAAISGAINDTINHTSALFATAAMFALITFATTSYFADTRKSVVFAGRKLIILRRMMGLSYGSIELVLPSRRIEGANEPYHLAMFHGWLSAKAIAIHCICISSSIIVWIFSPILLSQFDGTKQISTLPWIPPLIGFTWLLVVAIYYRLHLLDQYETWWRLLVVTVASLARAPLVKDFEYIIYRARLSAIEARRIGVPLSSFTKILLELEDREFRQHKGVSIRAVVASFVRYMERGKVSGGSTITQQLVRTLFIKHDKRFVRRKVFEILLALWFDRMFTKDDIIQIYICSVRYEHGVMGIVEAHKYFFPNRDHRNIDKAEAFFLIERISNIRSRLIVEKVLANLNNLIAKKIITPSELASILAIFEKQIDADRISSPQAYVDDLRAMLIQSKPQEATLIGLSNGLARVRKVAIGYFERRYPNVVISFRRFLTLIQKLQLRWLAVAVIILSPDTAF
ncbi:biosynthetic peptidoglycan transglycosylase [Agrobacterium rosae]